MNKATHAAHEAVKESIQEDSLEIAQRATEAAKPHIIAEALRELSIELDERYYDAYHNGVGGLDKWKSLRPASYWLRDRAEEIEGDG